ncbi:hypothetical protein [Crossiella sp. CA198]|uniref:hypothetical protein n=1 Tax=Crossiella sp. CA198 TaxID=3455607 RepID=UPI003F8D0B93
MSSLFGQVWLWSLLAFVIGGLATWVLFVTPARRELAALEDERATRRPDPVAPTVIRHDEDDEIVFEPLPAPKPVRPIATGEETTVLPAQPKAEQPKTALFTPVSTPEPRTSIFTPADEPTTQAEAPWERRREPTWSQPAEPAPTQQWSAPRPEDSRRPEPAAPTQQWSAPPAEDEEPALQWHEDTSSRRAEPAPQRSAEDSRRSEPAPTQAWTAERAEDSRRAESAATQQWSADQVEDSRRAEPAPTQAWSVDRADDSRHAEPAPTQQLSADRAEDSRRPEPAATQQWPAQRADEDFRRSEPAPTQQWSAQPPADEPAPSHLEADDQQPWSVSHPEPPAPVTRGADQPTTALFAPVGEPAAEARPAESESQPEQDDRPLFFEAETPAYGIPQNEILNALDEDPEPRQAQRPVPAPAPPAPQVSAPPELDVTDTELADHRPARPPRPAQRVAPPQFPPRPLPPQDLKARDTAYFQHLAAAGGPGNPQPVPPSVPAPPRQMPPVPPAPPRPVTPAEQPPPPVAPAEPPAPPQGERSRSLFEPVIDPDKQ